MYFLYLIVTKGKQEVFTYFDNQEIIEVVLNFLTPKEGRVNNVSGLLFIILVGKYMTGLDETN